MGYDNVIEINGNRYDAITGGLVSKKRPAKPVAAKKTGKTIDGVVKAKVDIKSSVVGRPVRTHGHHITAHHPEHSKTLVRRTVHKPEGHLKPAIKTQAPAEIMASPESTIVRKHSVAHVDVARLDRSKQVAKHHRISHFTASPVHAQSFSLPVETAVIPVQVPPPLPTLTHHRTRATDMFERAIAHAESHKQPAHKHKQSKRHHITNGLAVVAVFLAIAGFITYLNLPSINVRIASMQAGFSASMPGYSPVGYVQNGGVKHETGRVTLGFRSGESSYQITQQPSSWNSQTLLENTVALSGDYQTLVSKGRTIYVYNGHNASWVDGGIRYDITGNAELSNGDITAIADSL